MDGPRQPDPAPPARIFLRPIGAALPLGLAGLTCGSIVVSGLELGWVGQPERAEVGLIVLAFAAPLQLLASVLCFLARDATAGTGFGILAGSWASIGLVFVHAPTSKASEALGLLLLGSGTLLALTAAVELRSKVIPAATLGVAAARFLLSGLFDLTASTGFQHAAGIAGLVVAGLAAYTVLALELEDAQDATVLPLFRRGRGRAALEGDFASQVEQAANEPGVRELL